MKKFLTAIFLPLTVAVLLAGCQKSSDSAGSTPTADGHEPGHAHSHDSHSHAPESYTAGVERLGKFRDEIKAAFEKGAPEDAHHALHDIGHLLESLPGLAAKSGSVEEAAQGEIAAAVESLFEAYGELDETLHGGDELEYSEVEPKIQNAWQVLKEYAK